MFEDEKPNADILAARLALLLHKTPDEVRTMSMEDTDLILYLLHCEQRKQQEESAVRNEMSKLTP